MRTYIQAYEERSWQSEKEKQQLRTKVSLWFALRCSPSIHWGLFLQSVCQHRLLHVKSLEELHGGK